MLDADLCWVESIAVVAAVMTTERPGRSRGPYLGVPVNEGDIVDDFELLDQHGQSVTLNDLVDGPVVMFFYPKAMTLVEPWRCHFRDLASEFAELERHEWNQR